MQKDVVKMAQYGRNKLSAARQSAEKKMYFPVYIAL